MAKMSVEADQLQSAAKSFLSGESKTLEQTSNSLSQVLSSVSDVDGFGLSSAASTLGSNVKNNSEDIKTVLTNVQNFAEGAIAIDDESGNASKEVDYSTLFNTDGTMEGNAKVVWNFLKAKGLSDEAAAGVMGNIQAECNFKTTAVGDNGTSYGLIQWHNSRWTNLKNFCSQHNYDPSSLQGQLEFLWYESLNPSSGYGKKLASSGFYNAKSAEDAAVIFHDVVEKSASDSYTVRNKRGGYANQWYNKLKGTSSGIDLSDVNATVALSGSKNVTDVSSDSGDSGSTSYTSYTSYSSGGGSYSGGGGYGPSASTTPVQVTEVIGTDNLDFEKLEAYLATLEGKVVKVPDGLGKIHSYMGWQMITAKSSNQYKLRQAAGMNFDEQGFGKIGDRYVVATTTTFGQVGDFIDVKQADGTVIKCIIGDIKSQKDEGCNEWGHNNGQCVVEFVVSPVIFIIPLPDIGLLILPPVISKVPLFVTVPTLSALDVNLPDVILT